MDSTSTIEIPDQAAIETPESRLRRLVPIVRSLSGKLKTLAIVSAASALVLWWLSFDPHRWGNGVAGDWVALAVIALVALVLPACATLAGYWTLKGVLDLPQKLHGASIEVAEHAREARRPEGTKSGRLFGFFWTIWSVRSLVLDSSGAWDCRWQH